MSYVIVCQESACTGDAVSFSEWFGKAVSDADWHQTATGHRVQVQSDDDAVEYDTGTDTWCRHCGDDIDETAAGTWLAHWTGGVYYAPGVERCPSSRDGAHHPARTD